MLELHDVHVAYGLIKVLFGVSLKVSSGESVCLLGRNGMGKSTILKTIAGLLPVQSGVIKFGSRDVTKSSTFERARLGIGYVPDTKGIFANLTVSETLKLACMGSKNNDMAHVFEVFPDLRDRLNQLGGTLSGGEQQMLSMARALAMRPRLLLLDEVTEGLAPHVQARLASALLEFRKEGTILLAEQNMKFGCDVADKVCVIYDGHAVFEGTVDQLYDSRVIDDYITV